MQLSISPLQTSRGNGLDISIVSVGNRRSHAMVLAKVEAGVAWFVEDRMKAESD